MVDAKHYHHYILYEGGRGGGGDSENGVVPLSIVD